MKITLPIYYSHKEKGKIKTFLVGMNKYERMHKVPRNNMKKYYYTLISSLVGRKRIEGKVTTHYSLYYKNLQSDAPNVISVIDKMLMDGLQECGVIEDDSILYYTNSSWSIEGQDKENPRVEVIVIATKEQKENKNQSTIYDILEKE